MPDPEVLSWLADRAVPLDPVEAGTGLADLAPMCPVWSDVRVIGLGEATHGTSEFFTLKHRLIEFLVVELGVRVVAMEASESAATAVNDFVTRGSGEPAQALAGLVFRTWNTREVLALLQWLRAHNADLSPEHQVRFVGIDPQLPALAVEVVESFLSENLPTQLPRFAEALTALAQTRMTEAALPDPILRSAEEIVEVLDRQEPAGSPDEHARARQHVTYLVRAAQLATAPRDPAAGEASMYAVRDRLMAEAATEVTSTQAGTGPAVAVWAHNGHLQSGQRPEQVPTMGAHLRRQFGRHYYALGLVFGSGSFRAKRARLVRGYTPSPVRHHRGTAPPTTTEGHLARAHGGDHLIDLHDDNAPQAVTTWLSTRSWTRQHGALESPFYRMGFTPTVPGAEYDGLAYVHRTSPPTACRPS
ncbi:erythromycin esterase [Saccharopolyspora lacisalsi]|uniref:Erythromycin esterase n=1 Tax=Halosaccharopolyspora lacisalsi TaxID=1000566 RepID=A0A839DTH3_9PSEU|nr:erythromycin esterase family protein [Halosaccharopolyspora lacisalsi]MBA8824343.1 erythromycin esterase [Halosaccharopolyspora lacisalsi]